MSFPNHWYFFNAFSRVKINRTFSRISIKKTTLKDKIVFSPRTKQKIIAYNNMFNALQDRTSRSMLLFGLVFA
jgi:hypothetical protein